MPATPIQLMQAMPIFGAIHEDALEYLLEQTRSVTVRAQEFFFHEGDAATGMFVIESGEVEVLKAWRGRDHLLRRMGTGDCFGEMALMDLGRRSASVRAVGDCTAIELRPEHLHRLFERDPVQFALIQMNMGREVSRRLRATDELLFRAEMGALPKDIDPRLQTT
ncbi:MAG TPA: cyclic nucleotide-binding domain-containing protein [Albitalea sp.]|uniref:Crp/Fnr family transcriptional regulator n=1 Tax=Piscinibacter sp. TaxID=1903157 RepID=UPI002ED63498